jgi:glutamate N-acetyltransferase/amino-acid N-acetyltransferase
VLPFDAVALHEKLKADEVVIGLDLGLGSGEARSWGCDLTTDYVHINADYTT